MLDSAIHLEYNQSQALSDVVVKLPGDPDSLLFVGLNQFTSNAGQGFLGELLLGDVETRADVAGKRTVRVVSRHARVEDPPIFSVVPAEPVVFLERFPAVEGLSVGLQAVLDVFRVNAFRPAVSQLRFQRPSGEIEPGLVDVVAQLIGSGHPDHYRCGVCDEAEPFLALADQLFGLAPFGLSLSQS